MLNINSVQEIQNIMAISVQPLYNKIMQQKKSRFRIIFMLIQLEIIRVRKCI